MNFNIERHRPEPMPERHIMSAHLREAVAENENAQRVLERMLDAAEVREAMMAAEARNDDELATSLAEGLRASYSDLGEDCPTSLAMLDARANYSDAQGESGTTGTARDYLMQRLTAVGSILNLAGVMSLPDELQASLRGEADKLATLLVAFERADKGHDQLAAK